MIFPVWFDLVEKGFSKKKFRSKRFAHLWKLFDENVDKTHLTFLCLMFQNCSTERLDGNINLDFCSGMFIGEADTGEPFSIGLKLGKTTFYLKAENRLELDNWSRVLKPFVQASQAFVPRRSSSSSSDSDVFVQSELSLSLFKHITNVT